MTKATHAKPAASLTPVGRTGVSPSKIKNKTRTNHPIKKGAVILNEIFACVFSSVLTKDPRSYSVPISQNK